MGQCPFCSAPVPIPAAAAQPATTLKAVTWLVRLPNGQAWGPVNRRQLEEAVAAGRLPAESLVIKSGTTNMVPLVDLFPQLRETLAAVQAPFSGQQLQAAVRPKTFLEKLIYGPDMPRYKADKRRETYEERQLIMLTFVGVWVLVWICGSVLAGLQGGAEAAMGAGLGFFFASLIPVGLGLLMLAAGLFEPEWLMNSWDGRRRRSLFGDQGARFTYMIPGFCLFLGGGMFACFMMAVGGIGGSSLALAEAEQEKLEGHREIDFDPPLPGYKPAGLTTPVPSSFDPTIPAQANTLPPSNFVDPLRPTISPPTQTVTVTPVTTNPVEGPLVEVEVKPRTPAEELKVREEELRNALSAYQALRQQWDEAYNKSSEALKTTGGLASDTKGDLKAADAKASSIATTLAVAIDSVKASHASLKTYCDENKLASDTLAGYVEPPADVPGLREIQRRVEVAKLSLETGDEVVFLAAVNKVELYERQRRDMLNTLGAAADSNAELQQLLTDLQEARKWAYQTRRTVEQKATRGQISPLLDVYPPDREAVARYGTDQEQRALGMNPTHADRFKEASRLWLLASSDVDRARDRLTKSEQAMAAYQARFGRAPAPNDPVGQTYTANLKAVAAAEKKLAEARTKLEDSAKQVEVTSSLLEPGTF